MLEDVIFGVLKCVGKCGCVDNCNVGGIVGSMCCIRIGDAVREERIGGRVLGMVAFGAAQRWDGAGTAPNMAKLAYGEGKYA